MPLTELQPSGDRGEKTLLVEADVESVKSFGPYAKGAGASFDWYNDRLQILVYDGPEDEPALHVRYNADGTIAEIIVRNDLMGLVKPEGAMKMSEWQKERDGE